MSSEIKDPTVSIDRASRSWACFDGPNILHGFIDYTDEASALDDAMTWLATRSAIPPKVVYPSITSMRIMTSKTKRKP